MLKEKAVKIILPFVYIFVILCLVYVGISFYNDKQEVNSNQIIEENAIENSDSGTQNSAQNNTNNSTSSSNKPQATKPDSSTNGTQSNNNANSSSQTQNPKPNGSTSSSNKPQATKPNGSTSSSNKPQATKPNGSTSSSNKPQATKPNGSTSSSSSGSQSNNNTSSSNKPQTQKPNTSTGNNSSTNKPSVVKVTGISLNSTGSTVYMNNTSSIKLTATVKPSTASNKAVTWSSNNTNVATINSSGTVSIKSPGTTTIVAKTNDGGYQAKYTLNVKKRVVIIIGASQVVRMRDNLSSYKPSQYSYKKDNGTLVYVADGGTGIDFQTGSGFASAQSTINSYSSVKNYVSFYVFFPIPGNTVLNYTCDEISASSSFIKNYAGNYNSSIQKLKNNGYTAKGFVVSVQPVKVSQANKSNVVTNENPNACSKSYRSNWKYFQFNKAMKSIVDSSYSTNLKYLSLFIKIMQVNDNKKNFSYKITYNTTDGIHWDSATAIKYTQMMLDESGV